MKLDYTLPGVMTQSSGLDTPTTNFLPQRVVDVPKDVLRSFPHSKRVGNYLLGKTLGEGSFAKVKEALHTLTGEKVAVKVIDKKKAKEDVYVRKNLRREGKLLQVVRHKHVIQLLEIMETENSYYLVTELCQGGDLMDLICSNKRLDESQTRKYIKQISSAVDYLHKAGILHRDLKVENLLLDHNKDIKIIDFGLSNSVRVSHTKEGGSQAQEYCVTQCGSPAYAAPELLGNKKYGPKVDIWSIGVNMYAMLTGNLPFTVEPFNIKALHTKMLKGDMNAIPETLSPECVDLLKQFLTADPESRISLAKVMKHTWITDGNNKPMEPAPFPNRLSSDHLDHDIIKHMANNMDYRMSDVIRLATNNIPNNATATYHLLLKKLTRYNEEIKAKGRSSSESRYTTPDSSKQAFRSGRRSAAGDMIRLTPVDKSHPRPPRRAVSQDFLRRQRTNTGDTQKKQKVADASQEDPSDTEKTLVRRKIQNARVLHRINAPLDHKSPRKEKAETALKNEHLPIKGSDIKEEDEDEQDENIEAVEDEEEDGEGDMEDNERALVKTLKGRKSPRLQKRYTDKLQVQEVITTQLTPRSVHPAETVTTKVIGLPHIDRTMDKSSKPKSLSRSTENGSTSPRSMPRKVYPSFGYINKTKATTVSSTQQQQSNVKYRQKSPGEHSSNSTSSSRDGQKSTCSNPNPSSHHPQHFAHTVENKGSVSDPSTKTDYKSISTATPRPPPAAKTVNIEMESCDKYTRNNALGADLSQRPLAGVIPTRTLTQNRRVVNIVYPPFNKARGLSMRQQPTGRQAMSCDFESGNSLNIMGEKALLGDAAHLLDTGKGDTDCLPLKARLTKVETATSDHHHTAVDDSVLTSENTHKIVLPSLPIVETKAVNIT